MTRLVLSYDVFDTVVTRAFAHPRDIFVHVGAMLSAQGIHTIDAMEFARARWDAELGARELSPWTEVLLDDIYRVLEKKIGWNAATSAAALAMELSVESEFLRAIPLMPERLSEARLRHGRLVFLSDMYLPSRILQPWLEQRGVFSQGDLLLISGEVRANKSSGKLFTAAQQQTGGVFDHWQHTGDHPYADVERPRKMGISATHVTAAHLIAREQTARGTTGEFAETWRSLLSGAMRLARLANPGGSERDEVLWEIGSTVAGPLFYGFVRWTLAEAKRRGVRRLYFLARDGQIFWRIAREIQRGEPGMAECHYLHASRLAFSGPAELSTPEGLRRLAMPAAYFHSARQSLRQLGLDEAWFTRELPARFAALDLDENIPLDLREPFADWLVATEREAVIREAIQRRSERARGYLSSVGLVGGEPVALVDAGWLGSIHRNLERILGVDGTAVPLTGFYLGLMPPQSPSPAGELIGYTNQFAPLPLLLDESHKVLIELLAQSDHGQVIDFEATSNGFVPKFKEIGPINLGEIRRMQDSILMFTRRMMETARVGAASETSFAETVIGLYRDFHEHPTAREARVFGFLPHADQLFEQRHATLCAEFTPSEVIAAIADHRRRPPHWWMQGQAALGASALLRSFHALKRTWWSIQGRPQ